MTGKGRIALIAIALGMLPVLLSGCCRLGIGSCTVIDKVNFESAKRLNSCNDDDQNHPVAVRIYGLVSASTFTDVDFIDLWDDAPAALGGDLVGDFTEVYVAPDSKEQLEVLRGEGVAALGIAVNFCRGNEESCRKFIVRLEGKGAEVTMALRDDCASIR